jgi:hypothetical protein
LFGQDSFSTSFQRSFFAEQPVDNAGFFRFFLAQSVSIATTPRPMSERSAFPEALAERLVLLHADTQWIAESERGSQIRRARLMAALLAPVAQDTAERLAWLKERLAQGFGPAFARAAARLGTPVRNADEPYSLASAQHRFSLSRGLARTPSLSSSTDDEGLVAPALGISLGHWEAPAENAPPPGLLALSEALRESFERVPLATPEQLEAFMAEAGREVPDANPTSRDPGADAFTLIWRRLSAQPVANAAFLRRLAQALEAQDIAFSCPPANSEPALSARAHRL